MNQTYYQLIDKIAQYSNVSRARFARILHLPIEHKAEGCIIYDQEGNKYLDCGGYGVFILGHRHPAVVCKVAEQLNALPMSSRILLNETLSQASEKLIKFCPDSLQYAFFTNSGAESVELGLKLARANGCQKIIAITGGYHGKTLGALSVTSRDVFRKPFMPLMDDVIFVERNNIKALKERFCSRKTAVILETIQGEGGVYSLDQEFVTAAKELCDKCRGLLIVDEIQTGLARTGYNWDIERYGVKPDVLLIGKGLSGGVIPCAALAATTEAFAPLNNDFILHSSTFGGSPVALAAATSTLDVLQDEAIYRKSRSLGEAIISTLREMASQYDIDIRGRGLLIGIDAKSPKKAGQLLINLLKAKLLANFTLGNTGTVRLTPSALMSSREVEWIYEACEFAFKRL